MILPLNLLNDSQPRLDNCSQITLVGSNGAGKSRFMQEMQRLASPRTFLLDAIGASSAERDENHSAESISSQYRRLVETQPYMRTDAVSQLDQLVYMLLIDEFHTLTEHKQKNIPLTPPAAPRGQSLQSRLDKIRVIWERLFPGNHILITEGKLMFATTAGEDLIDIHSLSQGEKTIFYYLSGVLYAPRKAVIFIESPSLFIHRAMVNNVWNAIERLRPDCTFVYDSVDEDFVASRTGNTCIWIKSYDTKRRAWEYEILPFGHYSDELFIDLIGSRKPVLFVEGDNSHSLDIRLYSLMFPEYSVRPLGSCEKVIESTRSFNDLQTMHHLASVGIVDRDRRTDKEVEYLRHKNIMVPEVAEIENLFLLEDVIKIMARVRGKDEKKVFAKVSKSVFEMWKKQYTSQALQHVRHRIKREVECRIDARFNCITDMEIHLHSMFDLLNPRASYDEIRNHFANLLLNKDYSGVLKVFNHKPMLGDSNVASLLGYKSKEAYVAGVLETLKSDSAHSRSMLSSLRYALKSQSNNAT